MFARLEDQGTRLFFGHTGDLGEFVHSQIGEIVTGVNARFGQLRNQLGGQTFQTLDRKSVV